MSHITQMLVTTFHFLWPHHNSSSFLMHFARSTFLRFRDFGGLTQLKHKLQTLKKKNVHDWGMGSKQWYTTTCWCFNAKSWDHWGWNQGMSCIPHPETNCLDISCGWDQLYICSQNIIWNWCSPSYLLIPKNVFFKLPFAVWNPGIQWNPMSGLQQSFGEAEHGALWE